MSPTEKEARRLLANELRGKFPRRARVIERGSEVYVKEWLAILAIMAALESPRFRHDG